jgi:hypothetical protein
VSLCFLIGFKGGGQVRMIKESKGMDLWILDFIKEFELTYSYVTTYRIARRVSEQFDAFMSGFNELIPQELINVFDERELEVSLSICACLWLLL